MTDYSEPKPDSRGQNGFPSNRGDDVEASGQAILKLLHKLPKQPKPGADAASKRHNSSQISLKLRKIASGSWKAAWSFIEARCSVPRHGFTKLLRRLRIA
jgi:hypothetical protein